MIVEGDVGVYEIIGKRLADTATYRLYLAEDNTHARQCLLQVAADFRVNGKLDRAAFILRRLKSIAEGYDIEYAKMYESKHLHYDRLYPALIESFVSPEQGDRRINALALTDVDRIESIVPLSNIRLKERLRVDPETSAWIMGRILKLLAFVHAEGIQNRAITAKNVLLSPSMHFAITLDWSTARLFPVAVPSDEASTDIAIAAEAVFSAIGGDVDRMYWPYDGHRPYVSLLMAMIRGQMTDANAAIDQFYEVVRAEYGKEFHEFTKLAL